MSIAPIALRPPNTNELRAGMEFVINKSVPSENLRGKKLIVINVTQPIDSAMMGIDNVTCQQKLNLIESPYKWVTFADYEGGINTLQLNKNTVLPFLDRVGGVGSRLIRALENTVDYNNLKLTTLCDFLFR